MVFKQHIFSVSNEFWVLDRPFEVLYKPPSSLIVDSVTFCVTVRSKSSFVLCLTALFDELQDWFITIQSQYLSSPEQLFSPQTNLEEGKCALCDLFLLVVF